MVSFDSRTARHYGALGQQAHVPIFLPVLQSWAGPLEGQTVLDFGCGPGDFTAWMVQQGAGGVLAIDESQDLLDQARSLILATQDSDTASRVTFRRGNERALPVPRPVDLVLCSLALMMCEWEVQLDRCMAGLIASMHRTGRTILFVTHPCFRSETYPAFRYELPPEYSYWNSGVRYGVVLDPPQRGVQAVIHDHHWTLTDYTRAIALGGGVIADLQELPAAYDDQGEPTGPPAYLALLVQHAARDVRRPLRRRKSR